MPRRIPTTDDTVLRDRQEVAAARRRYDVEGKSPLPVAQDLRVLGEVPKADRVRHVEFDDGSTTRVERDAANPALVSPQPEKERSLVVPELHGSDTDGHHAATRAVSETHQASLIGDELPLEIP